MKIHSLFVVAAVSILAASCTAGTSGIFASIEREQKVVSLGGISKTATITSMAELTDALYTHQYFATGGKTLFSRPLGTVTWNKTPVGGSSQVTAVGSAGTLNHEVIFAVGSGTLYQYTPASATWSPISLPNGDTASDLIPVMDNTGYFNSELLVVTYQTVNGQPSYQDVYQIPASGTLNTTPINLLTVTNVGLSTPLNGLSANVVSAVFTGATGSPASTYYFASQSYLWKNDTAFTTVNTTKIAVSNVSYGYQGLLFLHQGSSNTLYLSTMSNAGTGGGVYYLASPSGTSFSFNSIAAGVNLNNKPIWFTQFLYNIYNGTLWIATGPTTLTEGTGYMEISGTSLSTTPSTDTNNYGSTVLPTSAVGTLFADHESTTTPNYFLGTDSQGLWLWSSSSRTWSQQ